MRSAMISKLTLILAVASIAVAGCKKDKAPKPVEPAKKLARVEENGQTTASFQYNGDGSVKSIAMNEGVAVTFNFIYNAQKKVAEISNTAGMTTKFVYQNGILTLAENFEDGDKISENSFQYENGKMKSNTLLSAISDENGDVDYIPTYRTVYHYNGAGNVEKISIYALNDEDELALESEFVYSQYDNKKNPMAAIAEFSQVFMYEPVAVNNALLEKWQSPAGAVLETTQNEYTYDAAGYPTALKSTVTPQGGAATVRNVKFFY